MVSNLNYPPGANDHNANAPARCARLMTPFVYEPVMVSNHSCPRAANDRNANAPARFARPMTPFV